MTQLIYDLARVGTASSWHKTIALSKSRDMSYRRAGEGKKLRLGELISFLIRTLSAKEEQKQREKGIHLI